MFRVFRAHWYEKKLQKLSVKEQQRISAFEQQIKKNPFSGRSLGYKFIREKRFNGKRVLFLIYEEEKVVYFVTITDKKAQQNDIDFIKAHLDIYREELKSRLL